MPNVRLFSQSTSTAADGTVRSNSMKTPKSYVTLQTVEPVKLDDGREEILIFTFPFAPTDISIDGLAHEYAELARPGRLPLVRYSKQKPLTININVLVTHESRRGISSAEDNLIALSDLSRKKRDLILTGLGPVFTRAKYRITDMSATVNRLNPNNRITMASVSMTLTQSVTVTPTVPGMIKIKDVDWAALAAAAAAATKSSGNKPRWPELDNAADEPFEDPPNPGYGYLYRS